MFEVAMDRENLVLDHITAAKDYRRETDQIRRDAVHMSRQKRRVKDLENTELPSDETVETTVSNVDETVKTTGMKLENLQAITLNEYPDTSAPEVKDYPIRAREDDHGALIPTNPDTFGSWVRKNIPDPNKHRDALRLLRERRMTPEILRRFAA